MSTAFERFADLRATWAKALADGGAVIGAFDGALLVGEVIFRPRLTQSMAQLESLQVSAQYRLQGIARRLFALEPDDIHMTLRL